MPTYKLDPAAFNRHVLNADWMVEAMRARAEKAREVAESVSPESTDARHGHYLDDFAVTARKYGGANGDRAAAILSNSNYVAWWVEYGNVNTPEYAPLRTAISTEGGS